MQTEAIAIVKQNLPYVVTELNLGMLKENR